MIATWTSTSTFRGSSSYASRPFRGRNTLSLNMRETSTCDPPFPNPPPTLLLSSPFLNPLRHPGSCAIHQMGDRSKGHFLRTARWAPRSRGAARGSARSTPKRTPRLAVCGWRGRAVGSPHTSQLDVRPWTNTALAQLA